MNLKYEGLLAVLLGGMVIGLAYSTKSGRAYLAVGIFLLGVLLVYALNWYYNSWVEKIEDERTELISTKSTRNAFAVISVVLFAEYLWEYSNGNTETATKLLIPLALGVLVLLVSQYWYARVM
ncbi:DUF2178 domain-containing protein [Thermococcus thioreducens]|uniref:Predicted membrane protein n=1 Tax=Thermococcus thioreducens TaxID=277988 RepID=A0A0Q2RCC9_9EURY|nr:DUF2178 domain-containing protein [Thermococcus thioreducens]ASJ13072.1 hypothetical protein A3L14_09320 [Thermococcus thioreducens]KQH81582.1 hypothetical protein AMR53_10195 [Thermococcus thioreducens]SEV81564.1 Predicted membrane protein [Thermococcus thioreducens]